MGRASQAGWGGVARRGAGALSDPTELESRPPRSPPRTSRSEASSVPERREPAARFQIKSSGTRRPIADPERPSRSEATTATAPPTRKKRKREVPFDVSTELREVASPREVARIELRLADAARAYERERYLDALPTLRDLARTARGSSAVRELLGLTYYRLGRWKEALAELREFAAMTASVDQNPVIADCERALGRHAAVEELFAELRRTGAGSDVLAEGRLVMAGSLADRGMINDAIDLLLPAVNRAVRKPLDRHLRQWYAIADLYERSGDMPRAREYFMKVVTADPEMSNVVERLAALR